MAVDLDAPALFREHLARGVHRAQQLLNESAPQLPDEQNTRLVLQILSYALSLPDIWPPTSYLLVDMAPRMEQAGYRDDWLFFLEKAIARSQAQGDGPTEAELRLQLGILYRLVGRYDEACIHLEASAAGFQALGDARGQARALHRWASVEERKRRYDKARELVDAALALLADDDPERARGYNVLGVIAYTAGNFTGAKALFSQALHYWEQSNDVRMMAWGLTNLGSALRPQGKYQEAIECYGRAAELFSAISDPVNEARARMNWGNVHQSMGQHAQALELYTLAEPVFRQSNDRHTLAVLYGNMARAQRLLKQWDQAEGLYQTSIERSQQSDNLRQEIFAREGLGLTNLGQDDRQRARSQFQEALALLSVFEGTPFYESSRKELLSLLRQCHDEDETGVEPGGTRHFDE